MAEAEIWLLKIGKKIEANPKFYAVIKNSKLSEIGKKIKQFPILYRELEKYQQGHFWTMNNYVDNNYLTVSFFLRELAGLMKGKVDLDKEIKRLSQTPFRNEAAKNALLKELKLSLELRNLLTVSEDFTKWQDERKKKTYWYVHYLSLILQEVGRRFDFSLHELKYFNYPETLELFDKGNRYKVTRPEAKNRIKFCTWYQKGSLFEQFSGPTAVKLKNEFLSSNKEKKVNDFRGMSASKGVAKGVVSIVKSVKDCGKVKKGNVIVAVMTRPDYVPAMKKAVAIVTNEGGVTCHAAIISRELGIPCVIGTKIATEVLKDGDIVEVNANHGVVKLVNQSVKKKG
jgi:phosphohistidine swiveling domain-containing protein